MIFEVDTHNSTLSVEDVDTTSWLTIFEVNVEIRYESKRNILLKRKFNYEKK